MTTYPITGGSVPTWTLADRVRKARMHAGLEQVELGERTGLSRGALSSIEHGKSNPRRATIISIALACGVDVNWLRDGETPADPDGSDGGSECAIRDSNPEPAELAA